MNKYVLVKKILTNLSVCVSARRGENEKQERRKQGTPDRREEEQSAKTHTSPHHIHMTRTCHFRQSCISQNNAKTSANVSETLLLCVQFEGLREAQQQLHVIKKERLPTHVPASRFTENLLVAAVHKCLVVVVRLGVGVSICTEGGGMENRIKRSSKKKDATHHTHAPLAK